MFYAYPVSDCLVDRCFPMQVVVGEWFAVVGQ